MNRAIAMVMGALVFLAIASFLLIFVLLPAYATTGTGLEVQHIDSNLTIGPGQSKTFEDIEVHLEGDSAILVEGGSLKINNSVITSWDSDTGGPVPAGERRGYIFIESPDDNTSITNSELANLGFFLEGTAKNNGIVYYDLTDDKSQQHVLANNNIHDNYMGLFTKDASNIVVENNKVHNNIKYGLDPHSRSTDLLIRGNEVFDNGHIGIICSGDCERISILDNTVHNNTKGGIMLSLRSNDSEIIGNTVFDQRNSSAISVSKSFNNTVMSNQIYQVLNGIDIKAGGSNNRIIDNKIADYERSGIRILANTTGNAIEDNTIHMPQGREGHAIAMNPAVKSSNNETNNLIVHPEHGMVED